MKLKDIIWETCSKCGRSTKVIQDESYCCDECKIPIDDKLNPKQNIYPEILNLTIFWKNGIGIGETTYNQYCSWKCLVKALKKIIKNRNIGFFSLPLCSFDNKNKGQRPKDLMDLFK